jgi:hypothetical protein
VCFYLKRERKDKVQKVHVRVRSVYTVSAIYLITAEPGITGVELRLHWSETLIISTKTEMYMYTVPFKHAPAPARFPPPPLLMGLNSSDTLYMALKEGVVC